MKSYLTSDARLKIYEMMIIPLITYSSSIHLNYNQSHKQKLQSIDWRATNIIENGNEITSIENNAKRERCLFVKKCLLKTFNNNTFNWYFEVQNHNQHTRNNLRNIKLAKVKLETARNSFFFGAAMLYNSLPTVIKEIDNISEYKN